MPHIRQETGETLPDRRRDGSGRRGCSAWHGPRPPGGRRDGIHPGFQGVRPSARFPGGPDIEGKRRRHGRLHPGDIPPGIIRAGASFEGVDPVFLKDLHGLHPHRPDEHGTPRLSEGFQDVRAPGASPGKARLRPEPLREIPEHGTEQGCSPSPGCPFPA